MIDPKPDPGNSPPENWTEDLDEESLRRVRELLAQQRKDAPGIEEVETDGDSSSSDPQ